MTPPIQESHRLADEAIPAPFTTLPSVAERSLVRRAGGVSRNCGVVGLQIEPLLLTRFDARLRHLPSSSIDRVPEVHLPKLDEREEKHAPADPTAPRRPRGRSLAKIALEVLLISTGVFLGLAGEQWRENSQHR